MNMPRYCGHCSRALCDVDLLGVPCPDCDCWWTSIEPIGPYGVPAPSIGTVVLVASLALANAALLYLLAWGQLQ